MGCTDLAASEKIIYTDEFQEVLPSAGDLVSSLGCNAVTVESRLNTTNLFMWH